MTATGSTLTHLEGALSGETYPADALANTDPTDGRPLLARYDLDRSARTLTAQAMPGRRSGGMWRWAELLPVRDRANVFYLGEGDTPLPPQPRLGRELGIPGLSTKAEGLNPTGSFKARGMAAAVSRAVELGVTAFVAPSAGNAAGALAAYGAVAGADVTVLVPVDAPEVNRHEMLMAGGLLILVDGLISDCGRISALISEKTGAFDVRRGWCLPDVVVYPTGGGTGLVGMWKAFAELEALGLIGSERPRMVAVQAEGCAPIVRAFEASERFARSWEDARTRASGIRVPSAVGDFLILDALRESGGTAVAVDEDSIAKVQRLAGRMGAGYVSPESAAALAAVPELRDRGEISAGDDVVVFDCGIGHKYPPPPGLPEPPTIDPDDFDPETLLAGG